MGAQRAAEPVGHRTGQTMTAMRYRTYGAPEDVVVAEEVPVPRPGPGEVLVEVRAAGVNPYDWHFVRGLPTFMRLQAGLRAPKRRALGADLAGTVVAVGAGVTRFSPGDAVLGEVDAGAFAEQAVVPEESLAPKPARLSFEEAAAVPMAGLTALQGLGVGGLGVGGLGVRGPGRSAGVRAGRRLLVNGASGGVGTFAVQLAVSSGVEVTGVCSTPNVELVRSLGATRVVDYTREDFTHGDERYDVVLDLVGNRSVSEVRRALTKGGAYVACFGQPEHRWLGPLAQLARMKVVSPLVGQRMTTFVAEPRAADLRTLADLVATGELRPVMDRTYPLARAGEAIAYVEEGHARGKVVLTV